QELVAEQGVLGELGAARLGETDSEQLPRVVPLIQRLSDIYSLITLQPYEWGVQRAGKFFGGLSLADSRLALDQHRLAQSRCAKQRHDRAIVSEGVDTVEHASEAVQYPPKVGR